MGFTPTCIYYDHVDIIWITWSNCALWIEISIATPLPLVFSRYNWYFSMALSPPIKAVLLELNAMQLDCLEQLLISEILLEYNLNHDTTVWLMQDSWIWVVWKRRTTTIPLVVHPISRMNCLKDVEGIPKFETHPICYGPKYGHPSIIFTDFTIQSINGWYQSHVCACFCINKSVDGSRVSMSSDVVNKIDVKPILPY